ncbi:hypothetical protein BY458DRAFT_526341 [Sporodiniella umbellata]|nr:hypothetical protein BY458DRAFT_526341 [Sporodiniella umbellata]
MQPSIALRAVHKPLIRFVGPRAALWKDVPNHSGPHPLTPFDLVKHTAQAEKPTKKATSGVLEFGELPAKYRRSLITEAEMEAIESGGATHFF